LVDFWRIGGKAGAQGFATDLQQYAATAMIARGKAPGAGQGLGQGALGLGGILAREGLGRRRCQPRPREDAGAENPDGDQEEDDDQDGRHQNHHNPISAGHHQDHGDDHHCEQPEPTALVLQPLRRGRFGNVDVRGSFGGRLRVAHGLWRTKRDEVSFNPPRRQQRGYRGYRIGGGLWGVWALAGWHSAEGETVGDFWGEEVSG
jgi:hypothetical protein